MWNLIIAPLSKSGGYTGFALSFRNSVVLSFCHNSDETWISLRPVCQCWSNFIWSIIKVIRFWDILDQNSGFHGNRKRPLTYNGKNDVSIFSLLFSIRYFSNLQVTRTGIKSRTSSNFSQIGPIPTELGAKFPIDLQWENGVSKLARSFLIGALSNLLVTRAGIKSRTSSNSGWIR